MDKEGKSNRNFASLTKEKSKQKKSLSCKLTDKSLWLLEFSFYIHRVIRRYL